MSRELTQIAELEDRRSFGEGSVLLQLASSHPEVAVRTRALQALGRLQDPAGAEPLVGALTANDPEIRLEGAAGVGLLALSWSPLSDDLRSKLTELLLAAEAKEADSAVRDVMLESLGRLATPAAAERLVECLSLPAAQARAAKSLGVALKAKAVLPLKAVGSLGALVKKEQSPAVRFGACYALAMAKQPSARSSLLICAQDEDAEVRAIAAKGLGDLDGDGIASLKTLLDDADYRTAAEAARALAKLAGRCKSASCPAVDALSLLSFRVDRLVRGDSAGGAQPLLAMAQQGLPSFARPLVIAWRAQLAEKGKAVSDARAKRDMALIDCRLAGVIDRMVGQVGETLSCGGGLVNEGQRLAEVLSELGAAPPPEAFKRSASFAAYVKHPESRVTVAALSLLGALKDPAHAELVRAQIGQADMVVAGTAAVASAKLGDKAALPAIQALMPKAQTMVDLALPVAEALSLLDAKEMVPELGPWLRSPHPTIRQSAAQALTKLTGQTVPALRVEPPAEPLPELAPEGAKLTMNTAKGPFQIALDTQRAPLTSANLFRLAKKGFFTNLTFHRVVPNFVVQGGDPRGDGEGGPGYSVRCEINRRPFVRGVVGMALSGKDTGGSQFFVTVSQQPHLDGRYTSFGEVVSGQEVVDALLEGDRILDVRPSP